MSSKVSTLYDAVPNLAMAVGIPLSIDNGKVTGSAAITFENPVGVPIKMRPKVIKSFGGNGTGILMHVSGDLYLIAYHLTVSGAISIYLLDGKGKKRDAIAEIFDKDTNIRDVVDYYRSIIVGSFYWSGVVWSKLRLPK